MSAELMRGIYAKLATQYPNRPYGGKKPASKAQKSAAKSNPWLLHLKKVRAVVKKAGVQMTPPELAKYARESYRPPAKRGGSHIGGAKA